MTDSEVMCSATLPVTQTHLEDLGAGRQDEDGDGLGQALHDLNGALYVDIEDEILAFPACVLEGRERGAVEVAEDFGPLEKLTPLRSSA